MNTGQVEDRPALAELVRVFARIGCISFGGPAGQIAVMHRIVIDEKKWIDEARFLHALNYCMLLPGPEATKLATYIGWLLHGVRGGLAAGILFVLPGALFMLGLSLLYALGQGVPAIDGALFGIKAAVLVIVVEALIRIGRRALKTNVLLAPRIAGNRPASRASSASSRGGRRSHWHCWRSAPTMCWSASGYSSPSSRWSASAAPMRSLRIWRSRPSRRTTG